MIATLCGYWRVWQCAIGYRYPRALRWSLGVGLSLGIVFGAEVVFFYYMRSVKSFPWKMTLGLCVCFPLAGMASLFWTHFVKNALAISSASNARLVPKLAQQVVGAIILYWLIVMGLVTIALYCIVMPTDRVIFWNGIIGFGIYFVGLAGIGARLRWVASMSLLVYLRLLGMLLLPQSVLDVLNGALLPMVGLPVLAAFAGFTFFAMLPRDADIHQYRCDRDVMLNRLRANAGHSRENPPGMRSEQLIAYCLGVDAHRGAILRVCACMVVLAAGVKVWLLFGAARSTVSSVGALAPVIAMAVRVLLDVRSGAIMTRIARTSAEQSLLRMSALLPDLKDLNRQLANILLRRSLIAALLFGLTAGAVAVLLGASARGLILVLVCCVTCMLWVGFTLRNYARDSADAADLRTRTLLPTTTGFAAIPPLSYALTGRSIDLAMVLACAIGVPVLAGALVWYRRRLMLAAPIAFPAGRLALADRAPT